MNYQNPLLSFKEKCEERNKEKDIQAIYDITQGLWIDKNGKPVIQEFLNQNNSIECQTIVTETRESTDRSEKANLTTNDFNTKSETIGATLITKTRESIDKSESSNSNN